MTGEQRPENSRSPSRSRKKSSRSRSPSKSPSRSRDRSREKRHRRHSKDENYSHGRSRRRERDRAYRHRDRSEDSRDRDSRSRDSHSEDGQYRSRSHDGSRRHRRRHRSPSPINRWDLYEDGYDSGRARSPETRHRSSRSERQGSRRATYSSHLERGLDGRADDSPEPRHRRSYRHEPTRVIHIKGIPEDKDESDIHKLFKNWPGVVRISVARDRFTGQPRGFAFVEFESVSAARDVMDMEDHAIDVGEGWRLTLDYSQPQQGPGVTTEAHDWICTMCQATNFARRLECHQCSSRRQADAPRVNNDAEAPSNVLKVSNLEPHISDEALRRHMGQVALVKDVVIVSDRQTGAPRGFAFVHFHSVADASKALHALQDSEILGQGKLLRLMFARDRNSRPQVISAAAANALEAAQSMSAYASWAPKEFDEAAIDGAAGGQQEAPADASTSDAGFQYDSNSGYYYHAASGYYYDSSTGLYYDSTDQQWKQLDAATGQYTPVPSQPGTATPTDTPAGPMQAPKVDYQPPPQAKKRGAVIGSAAQIDPEALKAKEAKAKEEARAKQQAQQRQALLKAGKKVKQASHAPPSSGAQPARPSTVQPQHALGAQQGVAAVANGAVKGVIRSSGKWGGPKPQSTGQ